VAVPVEDPTRELTSWRTGRANQKADLSVEQPRGPRVRAGHAAELRMLVQHHRRPLLRNVGEHQPDTLGRGLELRDDRATRFGVVAPGILHDEAWGDVAPEAGFRPLLARDLLQH